MPKEDWYQFLRSIKEDKHAVQRVHKLIMASSDGKKSQLIDFALSRLGKFRAEKNAEKSKAKKEEDPKEKQKKETTKDFMKVKSARPQRIKEKQLLGRVCPCRGN